MGHVGKFTGCQRVSWNLDGSMFQQVIISSQVGHKFIRPMATGLYVYIIIIYIHT